MKIVLLTLIMGSWSLTALGQSIGAAEFFSRQSQLTDLPTATPAGRLRTPLIQEYDLRSRTEAFDLDRQQYTLRFGFSTPRLMRAQQDYYRLLLTAPPAERDKVSCDRLTQAYGVWLELFTIERQLQLSDSLATILQDRSLLLERALLSQRAELDDLADLRGDRTDLQLKRLDLEQQRSRHLSTFGFLPTEQPLDFSDFVTVAEIMQALARQAPTLADATYDYELALLEREIEIERAESRQALDFLQFRYQGNPRDEFREKFSVGLAFKITDEGDTHLKIRELELEREWLQAEKRIDDEVRNARTDAARQALRSALEHHRDVERAVAEEGRDLARIATLAAQQQGIDPDLLLEIEQQRLMRQQAELAAYVRIVEDYLLWLEASGQLCQEARGGWLQR